MRALTRTYRYFAHRILAAGHSLQASRHDPPLGPVEQAIGKETGSPVPKTVEAVRASLLSNTLHVPVHLFGADKTRKPKQEQVRRIVKRTAVPPRQGEILFRLANLFKPELILELGTSLGLGTLYLSLGHPDARVITVEGNRMLAEMAGSMFRNQGRSDITLMQCTFEEALNRLSMQNLSRALVFVDGDHTFGATLKYFNRLIGQAGEHCMLVFHDIHWSEGMHRAWMKIRSDRRIRVSYDLYDMGIVTNSGEGDKKDFVLRY